MTTIHILVCACQPVEANNLSSQREHVWANPLYERRKALHECNVTENPREYQSLF